MREQAQGSVVLLVFVEDRQVLAPCGLLLVVDLAQIQHSALHGSGVGQAAVLHYAEVAVNPAILFSLGAAQKHGKQQNARNRAKREEGEIFTKRVSGLFRKSVL